MIPAAESERHGRADARGRQRRDGGRVDEGYERSTLDRPPLERVEDGRTVACGPSEDRVARVAENDESRRFGIRCADRGVGREALGDLEFRPHGPREIGQLIGKLVGECLVAVGDRNSGPTTFLGVQPRLDGKGGDRQDAWVALERPARSNQTFIGPRDVRYCSWWEIIRNLRQAIVGVTWPAAMRMSSLVDASAVSSGSCGWVR